MRKIYWERSQVVCDIYGALFLALG